MKSISQLVKLIFISLCLMVIYNSISYAFNYYFSEETLKNSGLDQGEILFYRDSKQIAVFNVEFADEPTERAIGLMNRFFLPTDKGMLFLHENPSNSSYHMSNMQIPLDIIFISEDKVIQEVFLNVPPCRHRDGHSSACEQYQPDQQYKYVLEIGGGVAEEKSLKIGDKLVLN